MPASIRSMKMRALDNVGAYAGRSPFQLGKPISAIVGPYRINSVQYQAIAVLSNKTTQEAVRAFGQSPTNFAIERAIEEVAKHRGLDRIEVRRRNFIRKEQFPYLIPSGTTYDSGDYHTVVDKVLAQADYDALIAERDRLRAEGMLAGIGIAACLEPSGANSTFEPLLNPVNTGHDLYRSPAASTSTWAARSPRRCIRRRPGRGTRRWSAPWSARCCRSIPIASGWCGRIR